jgi:hypothetical protein
MSATKKKTPKPKKTAKTTTTAGKKKWSAKVMRESDALDLKGGLFKQKDPHKVALSLKRSAERSKRRKGTPYQSAMSMLTFHINRGGLARRPEEGSGKGQKRAARPLRRVAV